jgi:hypothetical protein
MGAALLAAGCVASVLVVLQYASVLGDIRRLQARIDEVRDAGMRSPPRVAPAASDSRAFAREVQDANAVLAQLNLPWGVLFQELEATAMTDVTLLSIQPDIAAGQVRIVGEAKSYPAALEYVAKLESMERFGNVFLVSHEMRLNSPQRPVTFALVADWKERQ